MSFRGDIIVAVTSLTTWATAPLDDMSDVRDSDKIDAESLSFPEDFQRSFVSLRTRSQ